MQRVYNFFAVLRLRCRARGGCVREVAIDHARTRNGRSKRAKQKQSRAKRERDEDQPQRLLLNFERTLQQHKPKRAKRKRNHPDGGQRRAAERE